MGSKNFWVQTRFLVQKKLWDQQIWSKKIAIQTNWSPKPNSGLKKFCFESEQFLGPKQFWVPKNFLVQNKFWVKTNFGSKVILSKKSMFGKKKLGKKFMPQKKFGPKKCMVP